jgi:hypothetical protein
VTSGKPANDNAKTLTAALVAAVAQAFPSTPWNYVLSLLIVGVLYLAIGGLAATFACAAFAKPR